MADVWIGESSGLGGLTQWDVLAGWAAAQPHRPALVDAESGASLTFRELADAAERVARALARLGLRPGERVGFWSDNCPEAVVLLYAAARAGLVWSPINARLALPEARRQAALSRVRLLLLDPPHHALWTRPGDGALPVMPVVLDSPSPQTLAWTDLLAAVPGLAAPTPPPPSATAGLLYTSGTTGAPKGARHTHRTLLGWCFGMVLAAGWTAGDRILLPYPLFHMGGVGFLVAAHLTGATVLLLRRPDPNRLDAAASRFRATALVAVPTVLSALFRSRADRLSTLGWPSLTKVATTSGPLFADTRRAIATTWPHAALTGLYSATEAFFSALGPDDQAARPDSVGRPVLGAQIRIGDGEPPSRPGLIFTRGMTVFAGYDGKPPHAPDQWFTCQDVGFLDADGYLYITDRLSDLINSGGEKIASQEVERVLARHPAVNEAAVIGRPDPHWGERVHAVVSLKPGHHVDPEDLRVWCRAHLAAFKVPKTLEIVPDIPKTATGKIAKEVLRRRPER